MSLTQRRAGRVHNAPIVAATLRKLTLAADTVVVAAAPLTAVAVPVGGSLPTGEWKRNVRELGHNYLFQAL